jgi:hypothetical protein
MKAETGKHVFPGDGWGAIAVRTSPQIRVVLQRLTNTGLYGFTIEDTAERILTEELRRLLLDDRSLLNRRPGWLL